MTDIDQRIKAVQRTIEKKTANKNISARTFSDNTVTKGHALSRSYYRFPVTAKRVMEALISRLHPKRLDNELQNIELTASEYSNTYNVSLADAYRDLQKAADALIACVIKTDYADGRGFKKNTLMAEAVYLKNEGKIICTFNPLILPQLVGLSSKFSSYPLIKTVNFTSSYTWRFYELMVSWARPKKETNFFCGWFKVSISELRLMLGVPDSYNTSRFFTKVMDSLTTELKDKARIGLEVKRIKTGRSFTDLDIKFFEDEKIPLDLKQPEHLEDTPPHEEAA